MFVRNIDVDYLFVSDSQDVQLIKDDYPAAQEFDSFFVMVFDGAITSVLGMYGIVPNLEKRVYKVL